MSDPQEETPRPHLGGVVHTYQKYDPIAFPSPTQPPPDMVSPAFEHMLHYGSMRQLTPEELARAVTLDPSQIAGLGPSLDYLKAMLEERKRKILAKYETDAVLKEAKKNFEKQAGGIHLPKELQARFDKAVKTEQLHDLERLWYAVGNDSSKLARQLLNAMERLSEKYQVDQLAAKYTFTGRTQMSVPEAIEIKQELEKIDELLKQIDEAMKTAQIGVIDMEALEQFAEAGDISKLQELQQMIENYVREMAERQGLEKGEKGQFNLTPKAYRIFQSKLLERIFSKLQSSRTGRHQGPIVGEGAVEMQRTKQYEFGDSLTHMDIPQTFVNAMLRTGGEFPIRFKSEDIVVHKTRNNPKCATVVCMDMSGSMRYAGQYVHVKRMALAIEGLIRSEFPGDYLHFLEMFTFAKPKRASELIDLMPKPVTLYDPVVRLKVDMSRDDVSEHRIPPHFTNIQHALQLSRRFLSNQDTPNRQIILITDGLPTAHFDKNWLYLLYPPDPRTEEATMREALLCAREGITLNIFLVPSWSQSEEDIRFAYRLAQSTKGRVIFTTGADLDRFVVWDYVNHRREILG